MRITSRKQKARWYQYPKFHIFMNFSTCGRKLFIELRYVWSSRRTTAKWRQRFKLSKALFSTAHTSNQDGSRSVSAVKYSWIWTDTSLEFSRYLAANAINCDPSLTIKWFKHLRARVTLVIDSLKSYSRTDNQNKRCCSCSRWADAGTIFSHSADMTRQGSSLIIRRRVFVRSYHLYSPHLNSINYVLKCCSVGLAPAFTLPT